MKKFFFISLLLSAVFLFSCGEDGNDFTGTYDIVFLSSTQCDDADLNFAYDLESDNCVIDSGVEICVDGSFTLSDNGAFNGTFTIMTLGFSLSETFSGTYTVDGNNITICDETNDCDTGTIDNSDNEVTLRFPEDEDNCILVLTGKK